MRTTILSLILLGALLACTRAEDESAIAPQHAVLVNFEYGSRDLGAMFALEEKLEQAINDAQVGEYDGNEIAGDGSDATLFMYGPDADKLFAVVRPVLETAPFMKGAKVVLRYGDATDPNAREQTVVLLQKQTSQ